ncbi:MAG: hypothetical protein H6728_11540 [Myxococcales bacterium]|nr:hypothetical protein [Myxococcales bacterium]MCB9643696.1 hypothetical protein [Myxococcales bacterium]
MKIKAFFCSLALSAALTACGVEGPSVEQKTNPLTVQTTTTGLPSPSLGFEPTPQYTVNTTVFRNRINQYFATDNKVKGYQVTLIQGQSIRAEVAGGYATLENSDNRSVKLDAMTTSHYANVGSSAKFPSAIGLLATMASKPGGIPFYLDRQIWYYLPKAWRDVSHSSIYWLTFRDLITHRSGLPTQNVNRISDILKGGVQELKFDVNTQTWSCPFDGNTNVPTHAGYCRGVRRYSNLNFKLLGYLVAALDSPTLRATVDNLDPEDAQIDDVLGKHFEKVMNDRVFSKVSQGITPSCDATNELTSKQVPIALMYASATDFAPGYIYSTKDALEDMLGSRHCRAQGGWYYSSKALAYLLGTLETTDKIIPRDIYRQLAEPKGTYEQIEQRMAWSSALNLSGSVLKTYFAWNYVPFHNGSQPVTVDGRTVLGRSAILRLPMGYHAVGIINSGGMESSTIAARLKDAFAASVVAP